MSSPQNLITGYKDLSAAPAQPRRNAREDRIFRSILPRSRAALDLFYLEPAGADWENQVLQEGDLLSPLNA